MVSVIKSYEINDQERAMNHTNTNNVAGISSVNSAFISQPSSAYPVHKVALPSISSVSSGKSILLSAVGSSAPVLQASGANSGSSSGSIVVQPATLTKEVLDNIALVAGFLKCTNALGSGYMLPPFAVVVSELEQIHPQDMEEMDITWHIANVVFKRSLILASGAPSDDNQGVDSKALVVMKENAFGWDDHIKALNISEESTVALMAGSAHNHQEHTFVAHLPTDADTPLTVISAKGNVIVNNPPPWSDSFVYTPITEEEHARSATLIFGR
ncbi:hypothetical protein R6Q57_022723 [Mikania cordata]